jgi:uncharacterized membrane protein YfcA
MDLTYIAIVFGAFLLAGLVKGTAGMGLPPTAIALTTLALPISDALALLTVPTLATNIWQAFWGGHFRAMLRRFWIMGVAIMSGIFVSALTLRSLGSPLSVGLLGVILVIFSLTALVAWRPQVPPRHETWANPLCGAATGLIGGVTGMAAVPFLPYMQSLSLTRDELIQALGILFVVFTAALTVALADAGAFTITNGIGTLVATAPTALGMWLGQKLRRAVSPEVFRKMFLAVMFGVGIHLSRDLL